mmetsp:Transcript_63842/g.101470  ORF Transcript_63842/g.101470 Transcript_63842/m.101470 type:complete len:212 (-) Transcript_63842:556-1191(-)
MVRHQISTFLSPLKPLSRAGGAPRLTRSVHLAWPTSQLLIHMLPVLEHACCQLQQICQLGRHLLQSPRFRTKTFFHHSTHLGHLWKVQVIHDTLGIQLLIATPKMQDLLDETFPFFSLKSLRQVSYVGAQQPGCLAALRKAAGRTLGGLLQDHLAKQQQTFVLPTAGTWLTLPAEARGLSMSLVHVRYALQQRTNTFQGNAQGELEGLLVH